MQHHPYQIRPQAEADLDHHARAIAQDNLEAALRLYDQARTTCEMLADMPKMGAIHHTGKAGLMGIRYMPITGFPRYLVFYKPLDGGVDILRILHDRMDRDGWF